MLNGFSNNTAFTTNPFANGVFGAGKAKPAVDPMAGLRAAADGVQTARDALDFARTKRLEAAPKFDAQLDLVARDAAKWAAGVSNAERNLNLAAAAKDANDEAADVLRELRETLVQASTAPDGTEQAKVDALVAKLEGRADDQFAGKDLFTADLNNVHAEDRAGVQLTDHEGYILFDKATLKNFGGQNWTGNDVNTPGVQVSGDHARELTLDGNNWKFLELGRDVTVTDTMYVEFELKTTGTSEIVGIGLDDNTSLSQNNFVQLAGIQNWDGRVDPTGAADDGYATYRIKATDIAALGRDFDRLVFTNDRDAGYLDGTASFRNVRIVSDEPDTPAATGQGTGLDQTVYTGRLGAGESVHTVGTQTDLTQSWGGGGPDGLSNDFSVVSEGKVQANAAGNYRFQTRADDGVRLYVDGNLVIDNWVDQGPTTRTTADIYFEAGEAKDIRFEYYENGGGAVMQLRWQQPTGGGFTDITAGNLYNAADTVPQVIPGAKGQPMQFDGVGVGETTLRANMTDGDARAAAAGRTFNTGPSLGRGTSFGVFAKIGGRDLGTRADPTGGIADLRIADLVSGGDSDLAAMLATGDYTAALNAVDDGLAQLRYNDAAITSFARSMQADVNVGGFASDLNVKMAERLEGIREAEQAAKEAKLKMKEEAQLYRQSLATTDPYTALMLLS